MVINRVGVWGTDLEGSKITKLKSVSLQIQGGLGLGLGWIMFES